MAVVLDSAVATESRHLRVPVGTASGLCPGQTVVDHTAVTRKPPNAQVVPHADPEPFLALLVAAVGVEA